MFMFINVSAQERREVDNTITNTESDIFRYTEDVSRFIQVQQVIINQVATEVNRSNVNLNNASNIALIEQIGNNNVVQANNFAGTSQLLYSQQGDNNRITNQNNLNTVVTQNILQLGNNNVVNAINSGNLDIIQSGNGIIYEQIGTNPITNNVQIRLSGNARTVTARTISVNVFGSNNN